MWTVAEVAAAVQCSQLPGSLCGLCSFSEQEPLRPISGSKYPNNNKFNLENRSTDALLSVVPATMWTEAEVAVAVQCRSSHFLIII